MFLSILTLVTGLTISAVAIYYSVAGLAAIFAAATIPIIIMGGTLEVAKLVTTVWLHRYWNHAVWWLKTYLTVAVVVLMFITSMGIFGFLSKAHIDQTTASQESVAQVQKMKTEIERQQDVITTAEERIKKIESSGVGGQGNIQSQMEQEQKRIDTVLDRTKPMLEEQQKIIDGQTSLYEEQIKKIDGDLNTLQDYIDSNEIKKAQGMVGTANDGSYGPKTAGAFKSWQENKAKERTSVISKIESINLNPTVKSAREEIQKIREVSNKQIEESNKLINRLRDQLGKVDTQEVDKQLTEQRERISVAQNQIDELTSQKYKLEGEYRKLEAEVGPVKYIAEFIYGDSADKNLLEEAVRWVILIIIFVFDPLAVLLLLASQYSFDYHRKNREEKEEKVITQYEPDDGPLTDEQIQQIIETVESDRIELTVTEPSKASAESVVEPIESILPEKKTKKVESVTVLSSIVDPVVEQISELIVPDSSVIISRDPDTIVTEGVTSNAELFHSDEEYVTWEGKLHNIKALKSIHPELILSDNSPKNLISFGSEFPKQARSGDMYIRTDVIPHRVYKFNSTKWINVDKLNNHSYLQDENYLKYLIEKIDSRQYDVELLTSAEEEEISNYLN